MSLGCQALLFRVVVGFFLRATCDSDLAAPIQSHQPQNTRKLNCAECFGPVRPNRPLKDVSVVYLLSVDKASLSRSVVLRSRCHCYLITHKVHCDSYEEPFASTPSINRSPFPP